jgi:hypothetical protein
MISESRLLLNSIFYIQSFLIFHHIILHMGLGFRGFGCSLSMVGAALGWPSASCKTLNGPNGNSTKIPAHKIL